MHLRSKGQLFLLTASGTMSVRVQQPAEFAAGHLASSEVPDYFVREEQASIGVKSIARLHHLMRRLRGGGLAQRFAPPREQSLFTLHK